MFHTDQAGRLPPKLAFALVSFALGELGDGLNIFQGIYLVGLGWDEGSVGAALSIMGLTALLVQTVAGDIVDRTTLDRRIFLTVASVLTAASASSVMFVQGNSQHALMYITKVVEGIASSFIGPCLAALTLASFGPEHFDSIMANNILWGHVGSVASAILAGVVAYVSYGEAGEGVKYCFLVIGFSALIAVIFVRFCPEGDPLMGRGFKGAVALDEQGHLEKVSSYDEQHGGDDTSPEGGLSTSVAGALDESNEELILQKESSAMPEAASYWSVFMDPKTCVLCLTGFFFHFANANVLLVLGELMGGDNDDGSPKRSAIPLIAGAIILAQGTMSAATIAGGRLTDKGVGRKPLFLAGLLTLPIRCALVILWRNKSEGYLLSTQILDGLGGGFFGLLHPYLVADLTFGTGRFNVVMGLTASCFGLGGTMSNFLGQLAVQYFGHVISLLCSLTLSFIPIILFALFMPETYGQRGNLEELNIKASRSQSPRAKFTPAESENRYVQMT